MESSRFDSLVRDIRNMAYTRNNQSDQYYVSRTMLQGFLEEIQLFPGFHQCVAETVLNSISDADKYIAHCSEKEARILAAAAIKHNVRFVDPLCRL